MRKFFVFVIILFIVISAEELDTGDVYITGNLTESKEICMCPKLDCSWTAYDAKHEMQCFCWCSKQMHKFVQNTTVCKWMPTTQTFRGLCKICGTSDGKTHREWFVVFSQIFLKWAHLSTQATSIPPFVFPGACIPWKNDCNSDVSLTLKQIKLQN